MTRRPAAALALALPLLAGCTGFSEPGVDIEAERASASANPLDRDSLDDIMLSVAGPEEAVAWFRTRLAENPDDTELRRGYARALGRAGRHAEARFVWRELVERPDAVPEDRVDYAFTLARLDLWEEVEAQLALLPPAEDSPRRLLVTAILADHQRDWARADEAYARARALSPAPAATLNNWGVSEMARGDFAAAERRFEEALAFDPDLFGAKNNLALAYALQRRYRVPLVGLTEEERAVVLHNIGVVALRQGDRGVAREMFERAVATHPRHFPPASNQLAALAAAGG